MIYKIIFKDYIGLGLEGEYKFFIPKGDKKIENDIISFLEYKLLEKDLDNYKDEVSEHYQKIKEDKRFKNITLEGYFRGYE